MADFNPTIENIDENIVPSNHARSITGAKLNSVLKGMINDVNDKKEDTIADLPSIRSGAQQGASAYQLPSSGIPMTDLSDGVKTSLNKADTALQSENLAPYRIAQAQDLIDQTLAGMVGEKYTKPSDGIPKTDLASGVQTSLEKADSALQEHQDISGKMDKVTGDTEGNLAILDSNGNVTDSGIAANSLILGEGDEMKAIAAIFNSLNARISAIEHGLLVGFKSIIVDNLEIRNKFNQFVSEGNSYLKGAGVPSVDVIPDNWNEDEFGPWVGTAQFVGQRYLNTSTGKWYTAKGTEAVSDWVMDTN